MKTLKLIIVIIISFNIGCYSEAKNIKSYKDIKIESIQEDIASWVIRTKKETGPALEKFFKTVNEYWKHLENYKNTNNSKRKKAIIFDSLKSYKRTLRTIRKYQPHMHPAVAKSLAMNISEEYQRFLLKNPRTKVTYKTLLAVIALESAFNTAAICDNCKHGNCCKKFCRYDFGLMQINTQWMRAFGIKDYETLQLPRNQLRIGLYLLNDATKRNNLALYHSPTYYNQQRWLDKLYSIKQRI
jgi:hypothetical protein